MIWASLKAMRLARAMRSPSATFFSTAATTVIKNGSFIRIPFFGMTKVLPKGTGNMIAEQGAICEIRKQRRLKQPRAAPAPVWPNELD